MWGQSASASGFTLLELLVVMMLAVLITSLVPPLISTVMPGVRLRAAADDVATTLREARVQALRAGSATDVVFSLDDAGYRGADGAVHRLAERVRLTASGAAGLDGADRQGLAFTVRFYPDGSSSGGSIDLAAEQSRYRVAVSWLLGRVDVARQDD